MYRAAHIVKLRRSITAIPLLRIHVRGRGIRIKRPDRNELNHTSEIREMGGIET